MSGALIAIVDAHLRGCLPPDVPPSYREIASARRGKNGDGKPVIEADLVMFDGEPAKVVLTEHRPKRNAPPVFAFSLWSHRWIMETAVYWEGGEWHRDEPETSHVHFIGFRDDRYHAAVRVWGVPDFIHLGWDRRALREIGDGDTVVFANGPHDQEPRGKSYPDILDGTEIGWSWKAREVGR